jgi:hypothetical protein
MEIMKSIRAVSILFSLSIMLFFLHCTKNIAGSEVTNEKFMATIYLPNGQPAKNASVLILPANYVPSSISGIGKISSTKLLYLGTQTDNQGHFSVKGLVDGCYNVSAAQDSLVMFHDSIFIATDLLQSSNDTLHNPASLSGTVKIQPNNNVTTVIVQALGTDLYANVNTKGQFTFPKLAKGEYQLKFSTSLSEYVPKFVSVGILYSMPDTIKDTIELTFTGIPVVTNIQAWYDSLSGKIRISWHPVEYFDLFDYIIYRGTDSLFNSIGEPIGASTDTTYSDVVAGKLDTGSYRFNYRVAARDNSLNSGLPYKSAAVTFTLRNPLSVKILNDSVAVSKTSRTLVRAEIKCPYSFISKVQWLLCNKDNYLFDTLYFQSHDYSTFKNHAIDSLWIDNSQYAAFTRNDSTLVKGLSCRVIDNYGHTANDSTIIIFSSDNSTPNSSTNQFSFSLSKTNDTIFVDSAISIFASVFSHYSPIKQIVWRISDVDSVIRSVFLSGQSAYGADTAVFSWHSPGFKNVYCTFIDTANNAASDSTNIWVKP